MPSFIIQVKKNVDNCPTLVKALIYWSVCSWNKEKFYWTFVKVEADDIIKILISLNMSEDMIIWIS